MNRIKNSYLLGLSPQETTFVIEYVKDFAARRAAEASGHDPDKGYELSQKDGIAAAIKAIINDRLEEMNIDAEWLLYELVDNHRIARQHGNISASNTALGTIAKHVTVDALAKQKIEIDDVTDRELLERLQRGRQRMNKTDDEDISFL